MLHGLHQIFMNRVSQKAQGQRPGIHGQGMIGHDGGIGGQTRYDHLPAPGETAEVMGFHRADDQHSVGHHHGGIDQHSGPPPGFPQKNHTALFPGVMEKDPVLQGRPEGAEHPQTAVLAAFSMNPRSDQNFEIQILYLRPEEFQHLAGRGRPGFIIDYDQQRPAAQQKIRQTFGIR
jgi:hypothetical protein